MTGLVLGKFLPPHRGHEYLCRFAQSFCGDLTVVVGTLANEPIPGALRFAWMQALVPGARVVHLAEELPQQPEEHPEFWRLWREALLRVAPRPDLVFASETYGWRLAAELGARFIPVDLARSALPVSGTAIRRDPWGHWAFLPEVVRPYYLRKVVIHGAESTGKTTLAADLAAALGTVWVPEYARALLEAKGGALDPADLDDIARGQVASEQAMAGRATRWLVCDTDPVATRVWAEVLYGGASPAVLAAAASATADLTLLTDPAIPYEADLVRYRPADDRPAFTAHLAAALGGRRVVRVAGDRAARLAQALAAVADVGPP